MGLVRGELVEPLTFTAPQVIYLQQYKRNDHFKAIDILRPSWALLFSGGTPRKTGIY